MKRTLKPLTLLLLIAAPLTVVAAAWAYWSIGGSGSSTGSVAGFTAPSITSAAATNDSVNVVWSAAVAPGGNAVDGYYVQRFAGPTPSPACASSASTLISGTQCTDGAVGAGTYTYVVTAVYRSWTAKSAPSSPVTVTVSAGTPPTADITFPADGADYAAATFNAGCTPTGVCGTAADTDGVQSVGVSVRQGNGNYWNGTAFASVTEVFNAATLSAPGTPATGWRLPLSLPADGDYTVNVRATDMNGTTQTGTDYADTAAFTLDTTAPSNGALTVNGTAAASPMSSSTNGTGSFAISARTEFSDGGSGLASSTLTRQDGTLSAGSCSAYAAPTVLAGTPAQSGLATGCYLYVLTGTDNVGNAASISTAVEVDVTNPISGSITVNGGQPYSTGTVAVSKVDFTDSGSGIASNTITRAAGTLSGNLCGPLTGATAVTLSGGNDSAPLATGCYQYTLTGTDNEGHSSTATSGSVKVDTSAPAAPTLAFGGLSNAFYASGSNTMFFRPAAGGSFNVTATATDGDSGIKSGNAGYTFSSLAANGFNGTPTGGSVAYTFDGAATQPSSGPTVSATNNAGGTSPNATYSLVADSAGPTGGSVSANGGNAYNSTGTVAVSTTNFSDAASGIAANSVTRSTGTLSGDTCGTLSGATAVTVSGGNDSTTLTTGCYQYTVTGTDNVGNTATATSSVVKVDTSTPTATVTFPGNTRYYASTAWATGCTSVGICGTATDTTTGVTAVGVSIRNSAGNYWNGTTFTGTTQTFNTASLGTAVNGVRPWNYTMALPANGAYTVNVRATDAAGNVTPAGSYAVSTFKLGVTGLTISNVTVAANNRKATFSGSAGIATGAAADNATVTVKICTALAGNAVPDFATCVAPVTNVTGTRNATTGAWTSADSNPLVSGTTYYAQATQPDGAGNTWTFTSSAFTAP